MGRCAQPSQGLFITSHPNRDFVFTTAMHMHILHSPLHTNTIPSLYIHDHLCSCSALLFFLFEHCLPLHLLTVLNPWPTKCILTLRMLAGLILFQASATDTMASSYCSCCLRSTVDGIREWTHVQCAAAIACACFWLHRYSS